MTERWVEVAGYDHAYEVSDLGRVRSRKHVAAGRILKPRPNGGRSNHLQVSLSYRNRVRNRAVHLLVLEAFVGPRPQDPSGVRIEGRHLNDDKSDNRLANLAWGTVSENKVDAVRNGRHHYSKRDECKYGHPLSGPNLRIRLRPDGTFMQRDCRTCHGWKGLDET